MPSPRAADPDSAPHARPLVGRSVERARLLEAIRGGARLITLLGAPGIGKTALALAARDALATAVRGAVQVCDVSAARSDTSLAACVAERLDEPDLAALQLRPARSGGPPIAQQVARTLASRGPLCLVLDNFEQLVEAAYLVGAWLEEAPALRVVVTSRERLALAGEVVIELDALPPPDAAALFRQRAEDAGGGADIGVAADDAIATIVRRLDGIPLAIELAAARTRLFAPSELARRLLRGEDILASSGTRASRHRTLDAAIGWSWDLLSAAEQVALATCAQFRHAFSVDAAEALVRGELARRGLAEEGALELLAALRDKSMLRRDERGRLSLFHSVREYCGRRLGAEPDASGAVRAALVRHYAALAARLIEARLLQGEVPRPDVVALARLERDNLVALFEDAASEPDDEVDGRTASARIAIAVALTYAVSPELADRRLERALAGPESEDVALRAELLLARQTTLNALGRHDEALLAARAVAELPGLSLGLRAYALAYAGIQLRGEGDVPGARALHERAQTLLTGTPHRRLLGMNTACLGRLACDLAELEEARRLNTLATTLCEELGDEWLSALGLANLAQLEQEMRHFAEAERLFDQALERFTRTQETSYEAIYACRRAGLYLEWGKLEDAEREYRRAAGLFALVKVPLQLALVHAGLALVAAARGEHRDATLELERARAGSPQAAHGVLGLTLELLCGAVEVATPSIDGARLALWRARREELRRADAREHRLVGTNLDGRFARRMLEQALDTREGTAVARERPRGLRIGAGALWFAIDERAAVDLSRRGALRRILEALGAERLARPGTTLDVEALTRAGWPRERILTEAAATRVRVAIATLRKLGLRDALRTRDDGYLLDPQLPLQWG